MAMVPDNVMSRLLDALREVFPDELLDSEDAAAEVRNAAVRAWDAACGHDVDAEEALWWMFCGTHARLVGFAAGLDGDWESVSACTSPAEGRDVELASLGDRMPSGVLRGVSGLLGAEDGVAEGVFEDIDDGVPAKLRRLIPIELVAGVMAGMAAGVTGSWTSRDDEGFAKGMATVASMVTWTEAVEGGDLDYAVGWASGVDVEVAGPDGAACGTVRVPWGMAASGRFEATEGGDIAFTFSPADADGLLVGRGNGGRGVVLAAIEPILAMAGIDDAASDALPDDVEEAAGLLVHLGREVAEDSDAGGAAWRSATCVRAMSFAAVATRRYSGERLWHPSGVFFDRGVAIATSRAVSYCGGFMEGFVDAASGEIDRSRDMLPCDMPVMGGELWDVLEAIDSYGDERTLLPWVRVAAAELAGRLLEEAADGGDESVGDLDAPVSLTVIERCRGYMDGVSAAVTLSDGDKAVRYEGGGFHPAFL